MLIVLSGLPGTGKTTIGKALAAKRSAAYVRVDEIEHALIPNRGDHDPCAHWRVPMDLMRSGWSISLFQASQQ